MKSKLKSCTKILAVIKKCLILVSIKISQNISQNIKPKYYDDSNKLVIEKIEDATGAVGIEEFGGLKPNMYSFLGDDNSEHEKTKDVNRNAIATISHNEYKDILLNNKCLRHLINEIKSKDRRIRTYKTSKILFSCFDDKIYIKSNRYDELALGY